MIKYKSLKENSFVIKKKMTDIGNLRDTPEDFQKFLTKEVTDYKSSGVSQLQAFKRSLIAVIINGFWGPDNKFYIEDYTINTRKLSTIDILNKFPNMPMGWKNTKKYF